MPELCRFYGIIIKIYFGDHVPPHFHAEYNEYNAQIDIVTLGIIKGTLPAKAYSLVVEWAMQHKEELMIDWELAKDLKQPLKIEPLK